MSRIQPAGLPASRRTRTRPDAGQPVQARAVCPAARAQAAIRQCPNLAEGLAHPRGVLARAFIGGGGRTVRARRPGVRRIVDGGWRHGGARLSRPRHATSCPATEFWGSVARGSARVPRVQPPPPPHLKVEDILAGVHSTSSDVRDILASDSVRRGLDAATGRAASRTHSQPRSAAKTGA